MAAALFHLTGAHGGGVDRHIRDLLKERPAGLACCVLHCGEALHVLEYPNEDRYFPLHAESFDELLKSGLGQWLCQADLRALHLHGLGRSERAALTQLLQWRPYPYLVTVHDLGFLREDAFAEQWRGSPPADPNWIAELDPVLRNARAVIAPSDFIARQLRQVFPGRELTVIANGIDVSAPVASQAMPRADLRGRPVFAVLGALGQHKGSAYLRAVLRELSHTGITCVVIGYTESCLTGGWEIPELLLVHGAYQPEDATNLLHAYGARLAYFPKAMPESFSYALSEVWAAGLPALVHDCGALGERVRSGSGQVLPYDLTPPQVATILRDILLGNKDDRWSVVESNNSALSGVPRREDMIRELDALYRRCGISVDTKGAKSEPDPILLEGLLARNLDGFEFRKELLRLASELEEAEARYSTLREQQIEWSAREEQAIAELRAWNEKLTADYLSLRDSSRAEIGEIVRAKAGADAFARQLQMDCDALRAECERMSSLRASLEAELDKLCDEAKEQRASTPERVAGLVVYANAFLRLPRWLRRMLLRVEGRRVQA